MVSTGGHMHPNGSSYTKAEPLPYLQ